MPRRYAILDVFTTEPLAGNPLAVVLDADGLATERMQRIAAEFNLSETVFVFPPENPLHAARVRIFTPAQELPFAGHPTVGTAVILAHRTAGPEAAGQALLVLEAAVGAIRCGVSVRRGGGHAVFDAPRSAEEAGTAPEPAVLAAALGIPTTDIGFENHIPTIFSAGNPFTFVPIRNLAAMAAIRPQATATAFTGPAGALFCYTRETVVVARQFHARMFAPRLGIAEDLATGSAAVAMAGVIRRFDALPDGGHRFIIEQGFEVGRPSLMTLEIDVAGSAIAAIRLGGDVALVGEGTLDI